MGWQAARAANRRSLLVVLTGAAYRRDQWASGGLSTPSLGSAVPSADFIAGLTVFSRDNSGRERPLRGMAWPCT